MKKPENMSSVLTVTAAIHPEGGMGIRLLICEDSGPEDALVQSCDFYMTPDQAEMSARRMLDMVDEARALARPQ